MQYTGARILIEALIEQGVDTVFGYPGGAVLFIYDELYLHKDRIRHILVSHEQHAAHAADGYARASGRTGVCIATSGPGATNLVTGIATAYMDSSPIVAITGNVARGLLGRDSFQEVDIAGITMPIVKHNWIVQDVNELAEIVREAFLVAKSGRPGPVLIDIPKDITAQMGEWTPLCHVHEKTVISQRASRLDERSRRKTFSDHDIDEAAALIRSAKRPAVYAGGGVIIADAAEELKRFAETLKAPVVVSLMGTGCFSREHELYTGLIGMHGTVASNKAVQTADLVIAVGARFSDRVTSDTDTFAAHAHILHLDIDPAEINKNVPSTRCVIGNIKETLVRILEKIEKYPLPQNGWGDDIRIWKTHLPQSHQIERSRQHALHPRFIIEETAKKLGNETIAVTDVGQHQMWTAQFFPCNTPRTFITSGGLGTMGFGLGAAAGVKTAKTGSPVALFTGDGSFRMNCAEMATLTAYHIPLLIVIFNNRTLGMVRQWQYLFYEKRYSETTLDRPPDFIKLADAYKIPAYRVENEASFFEALEQAAADIANGQAALIEAVIDSDEKVLPMVPGGKPIHEQILHVI
ncbi:MAG: biosynthetic-type acetolactate synthase large subunit [Treponema sp.]|jgi:acetolactate synthase-1/2/3 large subunit|nr:biosynthetic-type acetolactate synthase large subunit [Treponema sp.]